MTNKNILTCPICGHNEVDIGAYHLHCITINCVKCAYESPYCTTVNKAKKNWNKRIIKNEFSTIRNDGYKKLYDQLNEKIARNDIWL